MAIKALINTHAVLSYYLLAFAISWTGVLVVVGPQGFSGTGATILAAGLVSLLGPSMAGIGLTALVDGRAGLGQLRSRLLRWRVGSRWYAAALLIGPLVMATTLFVFSLGDRSFLPAIVTSDDKLGLLAMGLVGGAVVPVFEELGWTGFATLRLMERHGVLATGVVMGLLWSCWHFPFFAGTTDAAGVVPAWLLVTILLFAWLPPYRVLIVWVYDRTESLLLAMLMHAPIVVAQYVLATDVSGLGQVATLLAWGAAFWAIALFVSRSSPRPRSRAHVMRTPGRLPA